MQFFAGTRGGHVEQPPCLLRFAIAPHSVDQRLCRTSFRTLWLERRYKKLRNRFGAVLNDGIGVRRETALQPGKQFPVTSARVGLQIRYDYDLKFKSLRFMDRH